MIKHSLFSFLKNKYFIILIIILATVAIIYANSGSKKLNFEYTKAIIGDVIEQVSVTGKVSPIDKADLSFKKSGVLTSVFVKVGDHIKKGDKIASLESAGDMASLESAKATLAELSRSLRPEEYAADESIVNTASTTLTNSLKDSVNAIHSSYVQAESAVLNHSDIFFDNPRTVNPTINIFVQSESLRSRINNERLVVTDIFNNFKDDANTADISNIKERIFNAQKYTSNIKNFLTDLSAIVNDLSVNGSNMTKQSISDAIATMNTSLSTLNQSIATIFSADSSLKSASSAYTQAENNFSLQKAGTSQNTISAQAAKVTQAQLALDDDILESPIDGIVTKVNPNVGEFVAAGQSNFAVQNNGLKIEAYVPEADIAKISIGNFASSTLDAYGSYVNFPAIVMAIDPAETLLANVPTYKVTLEFITPDDRIRSGMTSNLEILTHSATGVLKVPYRAITITSTTTTVRLLSKDGNSYSVVPIATGLKGSDGMIEIKSGLNPDDKVVTYVK